MSEEMAGEPVSKEDIRLCVRTKRCELNAMWIEQKSLAAQQQVMELPEFKKAKVVCCYLAMENEVKTDRLLDRCWKDEKTVCVPAFCRKTGKYRLSRIEKNTPIIEGYWKVWEPAHIRWIAVDKVDLIIVPGMAFDASGGRLGHGGGHYDKILGSRKSKLQCFKVGLAFDFQIFQIVPMSKDDVRMDVVVTEKKVLRSDGIAS
jgi:5-formyltetrahydrofolate cyclo-ligase